MIIAITFPAFQRRDKKILRFKKLQPSTNNIVFYTKFFITTDHVQHMGVKRMVRKVKLRLFLIVSFFITLIVGCSSDPQHSVQSEPPFVGKWVGYMRAIPPYLNDSLRVSVEINNDSTFKLNAVYLTSGDTAIRDNGFWKNPIMDSVFLHGTDCAVFDTSKKVLKQLESCGNPAAIKIDINSNTNIWAIPLSSLSPLSVAFNVKLDDPVVIQLLSLFIFELTKQ
jgi:hypothetical protein